MLRSFLYGAKPGAVLKMQPIRSLLIDTDVFVPVHNAFPKAHIVLPVRFFLAEELGRGAFASLRRKVLYFRVRLLPDFRSPSVFGARRRTQGAFYLFPSCVSSCFSVICPFAARFLRSFARIPAVVFVLPKTFPFTFSLRLFLSFKNLPVVSCLPARGRSRFLFQSAFRKPIPLVDKFPRYVL